MRGLGEGPLMLFRPGDGFRNVTLWVAREPDFVQESARSHWAELEVVSEWVKASTHVGVTIARDGASDDLTEWSEVLDAVEAHERDGDKVQDFDRPTTGRSGWIRFRADNKEGHEAELSDGGGGSRVYGRMPLDLGEGWIDENRRLLAEARVVLGPEKFS